MRSPQMPIRPIIIIIIVIIIIIIIIIIIGRSGTRRFQIGEPGLQISCSDLISR